MKKQLKTPIAFIIFNRPDTTQKVFNEIREARPKQLFVIADGARNEEEWEKCNKTREIINQIDWDCEVHKNYSDKNLGCKIRVSSGIDWFFDNVEEGIILEDDCVPHQSFFRYCEELLKKYRDNNKIMCISGLGFQNGKQRGEADYFFSYFNHVWGWASWSRAWQYYDLEMKTFPTFKKENKIKNIFPANKLAQKFWLDIFQKMYQHKRNTWDYQWTYACWVRDGLTCLPNKNLISNIGFGESATHTHKKDTSKHNLSLEKIKFPLKHPNTIIRDKEADNYILEPHYNITPEKIRNRNRKRLEYSIKRKLLNTRKKIKNAFTK